MSFAASPGWSLGGGLSARERWEGDHLCGHGAQ